MGPYRRCAGDNGGRCTFWRSGDAHRLFCLSADEATSCGLAARLAVAQEPLWPWRGATPGAQVPGSGAGPCAFAHARPAPFWGRSPRIIPAGRPVWTPPLMRSGTRRRVPWTSFDRRLAIEPRRSSGRGPIPGDPSASSNLRCHQGVRLRQEPGHQLREVPVMVVPGHGFEIAGVRPDVPFQPACAQRLCHDFGQ